MTIMFSVGEAIELQKYGKFTLLSIRGTIAEADAVTITKTPMDGFPAVEAIYTLEQGWRTITERFCWGTDAGGTTIADKVYYELWNDPGEIPAAEILGANIGFYCGAKIRHSNLENVCTHILTGGCIHVKLWNCSSPAQEVTYDFTVWYYTYREEYHGEVMKILNREYNTLQEILKVLRKS